MSRIIDRNHKYTDEEREWLISRSRHHDIIVNDRQFGPDGEGAHVEPEHEEEVQILDIDADIAEHVLGLEVEGLKTELIKYHIAPEGHKEDLQEALAIHLQIHREEEKHEKAQAEVKAQKSAKRR
jgi:hypothetical protein